MYIKELAISGYKAFASEFKISFCDDLNVIVGENSSGKSAVIDALRLLMNEDEFGRGIVKDTDFYRPFNSEGKGSSSISISCVFSDLNSEQVIAYQPWTIGEVDAGLNLIVEDKQSNRGRYKRKVWGGESQATIFEWELLDLIECIYLPPLRDAEHRLNEGKYSRLARLLKKVHKKELEECRKNGELHPLEKEVYDFNRSLSDDPKKPICIANDKIKSRLFEAMGSVFSQDTLIQFSEVRFDRIVEGLRMMFFPDLGGEVDHSRFRGLDENSLGYNNLLYLATVLAELTSIDDESALKVLLIEEPEAHLHPQLQIRLLHYLKRASAEKNVQVIVTSHSPIFSSVISIESVIHLQRISEGVSFSSPIKDCGLSSSSRDFIDRWMDVTKSTLLFSKGVIFVEGIAEAMLVPALAKRVIADYNAVCKKEDTKKEDTKKVIKGSSLEELGVSVINMNGIYFKHFMQLFCNIDGGDSLNVNLRCSGITDNDPEKTIDGNPSAPTPSSPLVGKNHALKLKDVINKSDWARLYSSPLKTLEYDLAFEGGNICLMANVLHRIWPEPKQVRRNSIKAKLKQIAALDGFDIKDENSVAANANYILEQIESSTVGKGLFAQVLASTVEEGAEVNIPDYIRNAVVWACGGSPDVYE